ncbi:hypothetical protein Ahy_A06g027240 [Arachis hypogaea]|uniref:Protein FAR1-RELATED SEQUENCE n=1 Tax=Arachis hypogaea TaxID=3818 RepID=A0A445CN05_ARAHY|nr:hypothetical protein Ahy_A06g027240 [Arachis hypogaea]
MKQYDNCLRSREQRKKKFDAANFYTMIPCATKSPTEAQFQHVYTHEKFIKVQAQFREKSRFLTQHSTIKCQCLLFESKDILCRHSLSVLSFEQVDKVAPKYILERWSKNVKRRHTHIKSSQDELPLEPRSKRFDDLVFQSHNICEFNKVAPKYILERWSKNVKRRHTHIKSSQDELPLEPRSKRFDDLVFQSHNICEFASESEELIGILHRAFDNVMAEIKGKCSLSHEDATLNDVNDLQSSPCIRIRGHPKNRLD